MSEITPLLSLPYIMPAQAQKHVTHNEAIRRLDALVNLHIRDRDLAAPPSSPAEGDRYVVAPTPSGAWSGKAGMVAAWQDGAWAFLTPRQGWIAWVEDEQCLIVRRAGEWTPFALPFASGVARLPVHSLASLPSASTAGAGALAYVSNASGGPALACSTGTAWHVVSTLGATLT